MRVRRVRRIVSVPATGAVPECAVRQVPLDHGALGPVRVVEVPAPAAPDEVEGAVRLARDEVRLDLEGRDEGGYVLWEFRSDGANGRPVLGQLVGDAGCAVSVYYSEEEGEAVCVLRMEGCGGRVVFECAVCWVEAICVYGFLQFFGSGCPGGC